MKKVYLVLVIGLIISNFSIVNNKKVQNPLEPFCENTIFANYNS